MPEVIEGQDLATPATVESGVETPAVEAPTYTQADVDRMVQAGVATNAQKHQTKLDEAKEQAKREKLEADGEHEKLFKMTQAEVEGLRGDLAAKELSAETRRALDAAGLSQYAPVFDADLSTMEGRELLIANLASMTESAVTLGVNNRLQTPTPPASPGTPKPVNLDQQIAEATAKSDWPLVERLNNEKMKQLYGDKH